MSEKLMGVVYDAKTKELLEVELLDEEINLIKEQNAASEAEAQAKASARASALAKLAALGLTEEEIAAL